MAHLSKSHVAPLRLPGGGPQPITPARLSRATLGALPAGVRRPRFDPAALRAGILHLGCGAFHRAHQAVFTGRAIEAEGEAGLRWGIVAASLRRPAMRDALSPQDGLYTVLERGPERSRAEVVGALHQVVFAPDGAALARRIADPAIRIVTLTVTAPAYCLDPATGRLDPAHPDIRRDMLRGTPRSVPGILAAGLDAVRRAGGRPPVVLSCDNLPANGRTLRQAVLDCAALGDDRLAAWIGREVQFPSSMVDRIVPSATGADTADATALTGLLDMAPVPAEPFRQWVIEEFAGPRPLWEAAGAEFVPDVAPWEASKLRLLNGTHMAIAYLGALAGRNTVAEAVADPALARFALRFMLEEQMPTLPPSDHDIRAYAGQLLGRWRNPGIEHRLTRVGRNGSEKLQPRLLAAMRQNMAAGRPVDCTILAVAAWMLCAASRSRTCARMEDEREGRLLAVAEAAGGDAARLVDGMLRLEEVFGPDLVRCGAFRDGLVAAVGAIHAHGPLGAAQLATGTA